MAKRTRDQESRSNYFVEEHLKKGSRRKITGELLEICNFFKAKNDFEEKMEKASKKIEENIEIRNKYQIEKEVAEIAFDILTDKIEEAVDNGQKFKASIMAPEYFEIKEKFGDAADAHDRIERDVAVENAKLQKFQEMYRREFETKFADKLGDA
jgi:hypothetical protein